MPWYLHLFWGLVVWRSASEIAQGLGVAGEWIAKALMKSAETQIAFARESRALTPRKGERS